MSVTASEARQRLFPLIEEVNNDQVAVEIVSKKGTAYLVSADEYRSLKETVYLMQSPRNAQRLRERRTKTHALRQRADNRSHTWKVHAIRKVNQRLISIWKDADLRPGERQFAPKSRLRMT